MFYFGLTGKSDFLNRILTLKRKIPLENRYFSGIYRAEIEL